MCNLNDFNGHFLYKGALVWLCPWAHVRDEGAMIPHLTGSEMTTCIGFDLMSSVACWFLLSTLTSQGVICPKPFLVVVVVVSFYLHQKCPKRLRLGW